MVDQFLRPANMAFDIGYICQYLNLHPMNHDEYRSWLKPLLIEGQIIEPGMIDEYPEVCSKLYFDLSKTVLNDRFKPLYESSGYGQCLYFIDMASHRFLERPNEFLELWRMIEEQIDKGKGHAWCEEWWPVAYAKFMNDRE